MQVKIDVTLAAGPPNGCGEGSFPSAQTTVAGGVGPSACGGKPYSAASGLQVRTVNVASPTYLELAGVSPDGTVVKADTLYFKASAPVTLRLTTEDAAVEVAPIGGLLVREFPPGKALTLLEIQGSATIEYFVSGS